jgi:hypothetical protein
MPINHHNQAIGCWIGLEKLIQKKKLTETFGRDD